MPVQMPQHAFSTECVISPRSDNTLESSALFSHRAELLLAKLWRLTGERPRHSSILSHLLVEKVVLRCRVQILAFGAALATAVAGQALGADTPAQPIKGPPPSAFAEVIAAHPELRKGPIEAAVQCKVSAAGVVSDCTLVREYPTNTPFGPALLAAASQFQVRPATHDGQAVDSTVLLDEGSFHADKPADWRRKPTAHDLLAVWPTEALRKGISGEATLDCLVNTEGALFDCLVQSETPLGMHFGEAALALTPQFLMIPAELAGHAVVSEAHIPINFKTSGPRNVPPSGSKTANAAMAWAQAPTYADMVAAYPRRARDTKLGGRAVLYCGFTSYGRLQDCETIAEEPRGKGFADAARKLAEKFKAFPSPDGKGWSGATVQLPVTFDPAMITSSEQVIGKPEWAALPNEDEVHAAFANLPKNVGTMRAVLSCIVQQGGWIGGCTVKSETPAGQGIGAAALALVAKVRLVTWTNEGLPVVGGRVNVPIRYESGAPQPAVPAAKAP